MISHLTWTMLVAMLLSAATALQGNRDIRERLGAAAYTLASCVLFIFAGGWVMHWIHG
jgi:hypothetical protein